ncbi:MAG: YdcF family protein [Gammaproteobacteria bacterium]|nr:YdcF family protein [Gammaproteobacteria bacterium]
MELLFTHIVRAFLLPPGFFFALLLLGVIVRLRFYRTGKAISYAAVVLLLLLSLPIVSNSLLNWYEDVPALAPASLKETQAKAIVILGGGRYFDAPEYQGDTVSRPALERLRYGAWLQRKCKLPILVTGGVVFGGNRPSEAQLMQEVLEKDFLAVVRWVEKDSRTTYENAIDSRKLLEKDGITHIILVTHALHMPRAQEAFAKAGFKVIPAPMGYDTARGISILSFLPNAYSLNNTADLMNEMIGRLWYHLRYY